MFRSLIFFIFLLPAISSANVFLGLGASGRLVKNEENNFKTKFPVLLYGGYKILPWAFAAEVLYYEDSSSSGASFKMENEHYEASLYAMRFFNYQEARVLNPYAVGGVGFFQERLETDFLGTKDRDKSAINTALKIGLGAWAQLGARGFLNVEGKGLYSKDFSPELVFELAVRAGLEF